LLDLILIQKSHFVDSGNKKKKYSEIAKIINRDDRSVWTSYRRACKKSKELFEIDMSKETYLLPLSIFKDRTKSILEQITFYLHEQYELSGYKVASLLNKHPSSIATVLNRARKKDEVKHGT